MYGKKVKKMSANQKFIRYEEETKLEVFGCCAGENTQSDAERGVNARAQEKQRYAPPCIPQLLCSAAGA